MKGYLSLELVVFIVLIFLGVLSLWFILGSPFAPEYYGFTDDFHINFYFALLFLGLWFAQIGIVVIIALAWKKWRKKRRSRATRARSETEKESEKKPSKKKMVR